MSVSLVRGTVEADRDLGSATGVFATGDILPFAGDIAPAGWRLCVDGDTVARSSPLGLKLAGKYGAGDGSTTYHLPPLAGRMPLGKRLGVELGSGGGAALSHAPAAAGLTIPSHAHAVGSMIFPNHGHGHGLYVANHTHSFNVYPSRVLGGNTNVNVILQHSTSANTGGITGGPAGQGNQALGGTMAAKAPDVTGTLGAAEPPWASVNWIIKL